MEHAADTGNTTFDPLRQWAIYRCGHGCFHITIDRLMVTLTDDEFEALQALIQRAGAQLRGPSLLNRLASHCSH